MSRAEHYDISDFNNEKEKSYYESKFDDLKADLAIQMASAIYVLYKENNAITRDLNHALYEICSTLDLDREMEILDNLPVKEKQPAVTPAKITTIKERFYNRGFTRQTYLTNTN